MPSIAELAQAIREQRAQLLNKGLAESVPKALALGGAAGLGGAGLMGLYNLARRNVNPPPRTAYSPMLPIVSDIPYPADENEDEKKEKKTAGVLDDLGNIFSGQYADSLKNHPLGLPLLAGAAGTGAVGGYKLMDYLMKRQNKKSREAELSQAREEYEQALLSQQTHKAAGEKTAAEQLGDELDRLADSWEKASAEMEKVGFGKGALGAALGVYLLGGGGLAALTGNAMYDYTAKRQPAAILAKAQKQHRRDMAAMRPTPIMARPVPMGQGGSPAPSETELAGDILDESNDEE